MARYLAGEYKPDQPASLNDGLTICDGAYPIANGYAPIGSFAPFQNGTLAARCIGAGGYRYTGQTYLFAATTTNIYTYSTSGYASVASGLSGTQANGVHFCPYAAFMLATNGVDPIKKFDPASPSAMTTLAAGAPTAKYLGIVRGFLVAGYAANLPLRIQWSDTGDPTNWAASGSSQAGTYDMPSGGDVTGVVGGEYGLIFQERRIVRMSYTGDDRVWQWDEIATDAGCIIPKTLATYAKGTFCWSSKGFIYCDGASVTEIGDEKVNRTFQGLISQNYFDYCSAVVDPRHSLYIVAVPSANPTSTLLLFNYELQKWASATVPTQILFSALSLTTSLEDLDAIYGSIDSMTVSMDSPSFRGGYPILLMFDASNRLGALSGPSIAASFMDGIKEPIPGFTARMRSVRPLCDSADASVTISGRNALSQAAAESDYSGQTAFGVVKVRDNWNLVQVRVSIPAGSTWTYYQGYDLMAERGRMLPI